MTAISQLSTFLKYMTRRKLERERERILPKNKKETFPFVILLASMRIRGEEGQQGDATRKG